MVNVPNLNERTMDFLGPFIANHDLLREKIGFALSSGNSYSFWKEIKKVKSSLSGRSRLCPIIDGLSSDSDIGSNFRSKLSSILNTSDTSNRNSLTFTLLLHPQRLMMLPFCLSWSKNA